ncbi:MAG TPA: acyl-CoA dehydrogenase family protein, partial [Thermohalobaculum sp.]|nr:acyl-CoA dehydrogenase family protein [Thermohalobaculum sp.]
MDFTLPPDCEAYRAAVAEFVDREVLPLEENPANFADHGNIPLEVLKPIRERVKALGLWAPNVPKELGGLGLPFVGLAAAYEEMNRSVFGPLCFHGAAPDDGNMRLVAQVGTAAQKDWWLKPVIAGEMRSAFVMTEPHPGSGSDPTMMLTRATRTNSGWRIQGRKWFITGAEGAGGAWRPLRVGVRRAGDPGRERADGSGRRAEGDPDPPRPGTADPLH